MNDDAVTAKQRYFQRVKADSGLYEAHKATGRRYYKEVIKSDPTKLEARRKASREYARKKRLKIYLKNKRIEIMYLLFAGGRSYLSGGACDLVSTHKKLDKATQDGETLEAHDRADWWHIYGIVEGKIVAHGGDHPDDTIEHLLTNKK